MDENLKVFHGPLLDVDDKGEVKGKLYPENDSTDVKVGNIKPAENLDTPPGSKEGERLEETLAIIKKFYNNLIGVGNVERSVADTPETVPENSIASGAALKAVYDQLNELETNIADQESEVIKRAPIDHSSQDPKYGLGTSEKYGHLKISDEYETALSEQDSVAASQKAINDAYIKLSEVLTNLSTSKADNYHASEDVKYGVGSSTKYGHLKISDDYENLNEEETPDGVAASLYALRAAYTSIAETVEKSMTTHKSELAGIGKFGHVKLTDELGDSETEEGVILSATGTKNVLNNITNIENSITILNGGGGGVENAKTTFNSDGSITVVAETSEKTTTFNDDGSITDKTIFYKDSTKTEVIDQVVTKTIFNNDGSISQNVTRTSETVSDVTT